MEILVYYCKQVEVHISMIIFHPVGGLGNRLRAVNSAIKLCERTGRSLRIFWIKQPVFNCEFSVLYQSISNIYDTDSQLIPSLIKLHARSNLLSLFLTLLEKLRILKILAPLEVKGLIRSGYDFPDLTKYAICIISSYSEFLKDEHFLEGFKLNHEINVLVQQETNAFNQHTIGVHIRRTDNVHSIHHSPVELFLEKMHDEIARNPAANFYVATDSQEVKKLIREKFRDKVIIPDGPLERNSREGIVQACIELYALSRTRKILGSYFSSFSIIAAKIGSIPYEAVVKH